ncbi:MAG: hypothetical protein WCP07_07060 [bacterium]|jgi:hypothetical protein
MNKAKEEQMMENRAVRKEMTRCAIDCGEVIIDVTHGQVHLFGKVRAMRGREGTFEADLAMMLKNLRKRPGIRDVITEWTVVG